MPSFSPPGPSLDLPFGLVPAHLRPSVPVVELSLDWVESSAPLPRSLPLAPAGLARDDFALEGLLTRAECAALLSQLRSAPSTPVGVHGRKGGLAPGEPVGSWRVSAHSPELARLLLARLLPQLPSPRWLSSDSPTDPDGWSAWAPVGLNPHLRFVRYEHGGALLPHYDGPLVLDSNTRSLMSVVAHLGASSDVSGGSTRFVLDPQDSLPRSERIWNDWDCPARPDQVRFALAPAPGAAVVFDHRQLHEGEPVSAPFGGSKWVLRTDVLFVRHVAGHRWSPA